MNNFHPESILVVAKLRNHEDVAYCLSRKSSHGNSAKRWLVILGSWMVACGEKLQARYAAPLQTNQNGLLQNKAR